MTTKIYRAGSIISINVNLSNGAKKRICFSEAAEGTSIYLTSDQRMQEAIEASPAFNKWFVLSETISKGTTESKAATPVQDAVQTETTIKVQSIAEAKDFLVETYDYTRSSLRSKDAIIKAGAAHNITFEGL